MADEKRGLTRPKEAPVDLFTLKPEPELLGDSEQEEKPKPVRKAKPKSTTRPKPTKTKPVEEEKSTAEESNIHVSLYIPPDLVKRLDSLKHSERKRLREDKKGVTRSTLIREAIERYLKDKEKAEEEAKEA